MFRLGRTLRTHPRIILVVLLAFAIEIVPAVRPVGHTHGGGHALHAHGGRVVGAARPLLTNAGAESAANRAAHVARSAASDWHQHVVQPMVAATAFVPTPTGPSFSVEPIATAAAPAEHPAHLGSTRARAPPVSLT